MTAAPSLSVVVAAHDVAPYLERCLASILAATDVSEVVVVDDASTDLTANVARAQATRDGRIRLVSNPEAMGPGGARNRGLLETSGTHVWFVDGDDWLLEGAVAAVLDRLAEGVDVVVVDHVRAYPSGRTAESSSAEVLRAAPPSPFSLEDWPALVETLHTPWNKVVRRALLDESGIRFSASPVYEDVSFTYRVLPAAATIAVVPAPGYAYRTSRPGALTRTAGPAHLAWADEWRTVLASNRDASPALQRALYARMLWHGWSVVGWRNGRRLTGRFRRQFLADFRALAREFRLADGPRDRVLESGLRSLAEGRIAAAELRWAAGRVAARISRRAS